ncbi:hypothetical protein BH11PLA2_BH11PLA2_41850 [soil metagenome]
MVDFLGRWEVMAGMVLLLVGLVVVMIKMKNKKDDD